MNNAEVALKAYQNIVSLKARKKVVTQEHSERIKKLAKILDNVSQRSAAGQISLMDQGVTLDPDSEQLLNDPTQGL